MDGKQVHCLVYAAAIIDRLIIARVSESTTEVLGFSVGAWRGLWVLNGDCEKGGDIKMILRNNTDIALP